MSKDVLDEREFELINIIGAELGSNQRDLSRQLDLSLGLTNMLIRRLVNKGFIRISQLNKRKVKYMLTPMGFSEKMRKTAKYAVKTICSIGLIKERVKDIVAKLYYEDGEREFYILGHSDLAFLIELVFTDLKISDHSVTYIEELPTNGSSGVIMICKEIDNTKEIKSAKTVDLIHELAKDSTFINHMGRG